MTAIEHPEPPAKHPADRRTNPGRPPALAFILDDVADKLERLLAEVRGTRHPAVYDDGTASAMDVHSLRQCARSLEGTLPAIRPIERRLRP